MRSLLLFAVILCCSLAAGQERSLVEHRAIRTEIFKQPPEVKAPSASSQAAAKRQAKEWVDRRAFKQKWAAAKFEYVGQYSGEATEGRDCSLYRMALKPAPHFAKEEQHEIWFYYHGGKLIVPEEQRGIDVTPPKASALVQFSPRAKKEKR
jgi:hypothetical protein